ncbi:tyrosine-type recombinase/integrase [Anaeromyxobacter diazotrophicus]|nr:tyrosine-type recombinase/integrase [Anaeromyxobacter diazotrophicus]
MRLGGIFGPATRVLLLTGDRRNEAAFLRWDELDGDWAAMPGSRMKNGRDFRAPLSAAAKGLVDAQPKLGAYVFTTNGKAPISGWGKAKERIDKLMSEELGEPVTGWRFHDLRRTMATGIAMLGYRREVIDRILAHVPQKSDVTSSVYNRFMYDGEAMEAVQRWAGYVLRLVSGLHVVPQVPAANEPPVVEDSDQPVA